MNQWLMQAAWNGDVDHLLKEININPHTLHAVALEGSETPLHIACFAGHLTFAATVIKLRQEFCKELNQDGFSPLHIAAACGHVDIVKELLKVDLGLCLIKGKDRNIPLHLAVVKGKIDVVRELLLSSLDSVECKTAQGETSLHLAVKHNQFEALQILIQHLKQVNKEDLPNCKDFYGNTILHLAVARKQYEVVDFLLNAEGTVNENMELNSLNKSMLTPLDILLMFQSEAGDREIEELLVQAGALKAENLQSPAHTQEQTAYHHDTRRENPPSPAKKLIDYFKYNNLQDSPNKVRNTLLVIIILITAATYQPALSPPGGAWQDDFTPPEGNNTLSGSNNTNTTKKHIAGQAIMGTHNPIAYTIFLFSNSLGFYTSLHMITVLTTAFPLRLEFQLLMFSLATTYATCMNAIAPKPFITYALGEKFTMSSRQTAVLESLQGAHAQDFLKVLPIEGLGQHMSAVEYRAVLKYRLMIPLFPVDEPCPICKKACLDKFGEHALHCKELPGFKYRHDLVRDVLWDVLRRAGISAKKEAPVNFLTDPLEGRSTLRPADVLVFGWEGGKHACVDLTGVSPLVGLRDTGFVAGQAVLKAESKKVTKHETACLENQHVFVPFAFDTFGALAPEAIRFLDRVQKVVHSNSPSSKNQSFIFSRVGFAIQKGVAAQLVARLPVMHL